MSQEMTDTTAPEGYTKITWWDVREGDVLFHENGDRLTVAETFPERLRAAGIDRFSERWEQSGFTPHRKQPELPNEQGAYLDKDGDYWLLDRSGNWYDWSRLDEPDVWGGNPQKYAPFTRLVPLPSSDAVLEVVQRAEPMCMRERITDAVMALLKGV